jgi:hypothetical protein
MREPQKAEIHDLGYQRYEGTRTPVRFRFWAIAENVFRLAWRQKFLVRGPMFISGAIVGVIGVVMYLTRFTLKRVVDGPFGAFIPREDLMTVVALEGFRMMSFVLALAVASAAVADDLKQGAFQFYFSRAIRRGDYILGKVLGVAMVVGVPLLGGPLLISILRLFYAGDFGQVLGELHLLLRALAFGIPATLAFALIPLGVSALLGQKRLAQIAVALGYILVGFAAEISAEQLDIPEINMLSIAANMRQLGAWTYDVALPFPLPTWAGPTALLGLSLLGLFILRRRVAKLESADLGGA